MSKRKKHRGWRRFIQTLFFNVANDPDDFASAIGEVRSHAFANRQALSKGILLWEKLAGKRFVDDHNPWRSADHITESTSMAKRNSHRAEIMGRDGPPLRTAGIVFRPALDIEGKVHTRFQGERSDVGGRFDAGECFDLFQKALEEGPKVSRRVVFVPVSDIFIVRTFFGSNPGSTLRRLEKVWMSSAAPTSNTSDSAILPAHEQITEAAPASPGSGAAACFAQRIIQIDFNGLKRGRTLEDAFPSLIGEGEGQINIQDIIDFRANAGIIALLGLASMRAWAFSMPCATACGGCSPPPT